jgi:putative PIN family toxin of toxin-antitoxin system
VTEWRAVLDAQVWVSAAINRAGPARAIIGAARAGAFRIVTSPYIRAEVREVFSRASVRRFLAPAFDAAEWVEVVELATSDVVEEAVGPPVVPADPEDDPYLWTAYVGAATHVVTWDAEVLAIKHFRGAQLVQPVDFLRLLRARR